MNVNGIRKKQNSKLLVDFTLTAIPAVVIAVTVIIIVLTVAVLRVCLIFFLCPRLISCLLSKRTKLETFASVYSVLFAFSLVVG